VKTVLLCGGKGTRLSEETHLRPKPMVQIGDKPILWHIMNTYAQHGHKDFVCALGYMGDYIKDYFHRFYSMNSDFTINLSSGNISYHTEPKKDWNVSLIDTGAESMTGGRLFLLRDFLKNDDTFMLTYGDGVSDVNITELLAFHKKHGKLATVTSVRPPARFGEMKFDGDRVSEFAEKPQTSSGWINGGYFVFNKKVIDYISGVDEMLEHAPLQNLAREGQLMSYKHDGFWQCMDTMRDKTYLNEIWESGNIPWIKNVQ
jgi:glucose-1-phosphate cytidylyltransferase